DFIGIVGTDEDLGDMAFMRRQGKGPFLRPVAEFRVGEMRVAAIGNSLLLARLRRQGLKRRDLLPAVAAILPALERNRLGAGIDDAIVMGIDRDGTQIAIQQLRPVAAAIRAAIEPVMRHAGKNDLRMRVARMNAIDDRAAESIGEEAAA